MPKRKPPTEDGAQNQNARQGLTREIVLAALEANGGAAAKRDLARALKVTAEERKELRAILRELEDEGALGRVGRRAFASATALPDGGVMDIVDRDADGELIGRMRGVDGLYGPAVRLAPGDSRALQGQPAVGLGDRVLVKIVREGGEPIARVVKRLGQSAHRILGVFRANPYGGRVEPADRKAKGDLLIERHQAGDAQDGDLVVCELVIGGRTAGPKRAVIREIVGKENDPRAASILAIASHGVPIGFSPEEDAEARAAKKPTLKGRTDLRDLPLITIDPEDARDHDDAVCAFPDDDPKNLGGYRVWVAIADVAAYVRPASALDRGAFKRGNSTYFPDRVAPMLPEALSADLCSLLEDEDRACLAVEMIFDAQGRKMKHRFVRGLMRSAAKLSYQQAQAAFDGQPDGKAEPLVAPILKPLWDAYQCLKKGRDTRAPLEIASAEHKIQFGPDGRVAGVQKRVMQEANKLIEEFMIQANVCAAETLEARQTPLVFRIHDQPSKEKLASLADFLQTVGLSWAKGQTVTPARFNRILSLARETEHADIVNEVVLRSQAQAIYAPENIGHFGLNLSHYAHFTSPIRRYSDLIVHRGLIRALKLGDDGLSEEQAVRLEEIAQHITMTERRSMAAEREATERYIASFLADRVGAVFTGRVSGVTRFGLFVKLTDTAADGLVPISSLGQERFIHDEAQHALVGVSSGRRFQLGQSVEVRLLEATPVSGGLLFELVSAALPARKGFTPIRAPKGFGAGGPRKGGPRKAKFKR
jgi:ribonuclease R